MAILILSCIRRSAELRSRAMVAWCFTGCVSSSWTYAVLAPLPEPPSCTCLLYLRAQICIVGTVVNTGFSCAGQVLPWRPGARLGSAVLLSSGIAVLITAGPCSLIPGRLADLSAHDHHRLEHGKARYLAGSSSKRNEACRWAGRQSPGLWTDLGAVQIQTK